MILCLAISHLHDVWATQMWIRPQSIAPPSTPLVTTSFLGVNKIVGASFRGDWGASPVVSSKANAADVEQGHNCAGNDNAGPNLDR